MTVAPPLTLSDALEHLTDALGANYGASTDEEVLQRALKVDRLLVGTETHYRPWATAARLIRDNTEYEVTGEMQARIDRKLGGLDLTQRGADMAAGILDLIIERDALLSGFPKSGMLVTEGVF